MRTYLAIAACLAGIANGIDMPTHVIESALIGTKKYTIRITSDSLAGAAEWQADGNTAVPLALDQAVTAASTTLGNLGLRPKDYVVEVVELRRFAGNSFYYLVTFEPDFQPTGVHPAVRIAIALDGQMLPISWIDTTTNEAGQIGKADRTKQSGHPNEATAPGKAKPTPAKP